MINEEIYRRTQEILREQLELLAEAAKTAPDLDALCKIIGQTISLSVTLHSL